MSISISTKQSRTWRQTFSDYLQLTKPRIVILLVFTMVTAMVIAAKGIRIPPMTLIAALAGGVLSSAGASVINQYLDRDIDAHMSRTSQRPIPTGRVAPLNALFFGLGLLAWSVLILGVLVNWLSALLALIGALYYLVIYTLLLKRNTALNIIIGGGAGAMPVLVGWAATTNRLDVGAFLLFAIIFLWTPPHSWALAVLVNSDYERVHVPMMPVSHGQDKTQTQILWYTFHLVIATLLPVVLGMLTGIYLVAALLLGGQLLFRAFDLLRKSSKQSARQLYKYSSAYLAFLFLAMIIDRLI